MGNMENQDTDKSLQMEAADIPSTAGTHQDEVKKLWIELLKTGIFSLAALAVIVFLTIAWFAANRRVQSGSASVVARHENVRIASKGVRQSSEEEFLKLSEGTSYTYGGDTYYYTEDGEIAMRLAEDYIVSPGASGSIEFYIIPTHDGAMQATLHLGLSGYAEKVGEDGVTKQIEQVEDPVLDALLKGHILLFENYQDGYYSNWLSNESTVGILDNTITIELPEDTKEGVPYRVTFYWIWPLRYENMVEDLYVNGSTEYTERFAPFVEAQSQNRKPISETGNYDYSQIFLAKKETSLNTLDSRTKAYNLADEYIGTNAGYLYLTIQTAAFDETMAR